MGIKKAESFCSKFKERAAISTMTEIVDVILYVDGPILLFAANFKKTNLSDLDVVLSKLRYVIGQITIANFRILGIKIYFDGAAPIQKKLTQMSRIDKRTLYFQPTELKERLMRYNIIAHIPVEYVQLIEGEAERIMYFTRDINYASIFYTKDTDIYAITYMHTAQLPTDKTYVCMDKTKNGGLKMYEMSLFGSDLLPVNIFRILTALAGTDYTSTYFSTSMIQSLVNSDQSFLDLDALLSSDDGLNNVVACLYRHFDKKIKGVTVSQKFKNKDEVDLDTLNWYLKYYKEPTSN